MEISGRSHGQPLQSGTPRYPGGTKRCQSFKVWLRVPGPLGLLVVCSSSGWIRQTETHTEQLAAFRRCSGRQLRRPFQGRGRGITALADSSYHSPFPMCLGSHRFPLLESPHSSCKSNPWLSSKPRPERPPLSQVLGIHFLI